MGKDETAAVTGTREWSTASANCMIGCEYDCRYCYAKHNAVHRWKRVKPDRWSIPMPNWKALQGAIPSTSGAIMFPTTHDITQRNVGLCMDMLWRMSKLGRGA